MVETTLILDVSNLAYRSFFAMGELSHEGLKTSVPFGIFRDVINYQEIHQTNRVVFCFDGGFAGRSTIYPGYKRREEKEVNKEMQEAKSEVRKQLQLLRTKYLPKLGFHNLFYQVGYEADDLIAKVCESIGDDEFGVIISTDQDLYQLLEDDRIIMWNPRTQKATTEASFKAEWRIGPDSWAMVKAIAGCSSDKVPGVDGVGEKTAIKYLLGELGKGSKKFEDIQINSELRDRNYKLTYLPFPYTPPFTFQKDCVTDRRWDWVLKKLGIVSLMKGAGRR